MAETTPKKKKKSEFAKLPGGDKLLLTIGYILLGLFVVAIILPMVYIILASFIDPITLQNSGLTFDFSKWTTTAYERVLENAQIWVGFKNALIYSVLFTIISVVVTLLAAYPRRLPHVPRGLQGQGILQHHLRHHHVLRRRPDPHLPADQQPGHA